MLVLLIQVSILFLWSHLSAGKKKKEDKLAGWALIYRAVFLFCFKFALLLAPVPCERKRRQIPALGGRGCPGNWVGTWAGGLSSVCYCFLPYTHVIELSFLKFYWLRVKLGLVPFFCKFLQGSMWKRTNRKLNEVFWIRLWETTSPQSLWSQGTLKGRELLKHLKTEGKHKALPYIMSKPAQKYVTIQAKQYSF